MDSRRRAARASRVANLSQRRSAHSKPTAAHSKSRCASGRRVGILAQGRCRRLGRTPPSLARVSRPSHRGSTRTPRRRGLVEGVVLDGLPPVRRGGATGPGDLRGPTKKVQRSNRVPRWTRGSPDYVHVFSFAHEAPEPSQRTDLGGLRERHLLPAAVAVCVHHDRNDCDRTQFTDAAFTRYLRAPS
jgi:hypothetical protein